ncbi:hypothetical protein PSm6_00820 [Pseudomonas solani]|uniref:Secreted protein n=1 Tax=Pseudomonas solani TaxID=2731552 RepID=A0ABM7L2D6_9PSED|nr:hypothetical protein PSm6_00820 [Pseudomonas solani]
MRSGTVLMALGIIRCGFCASPAVRPITSMPPKAKMTMVKDATIPSSPLGKKPPWAQRLAKPATLSAPPSGMPATSTASPARIIATMATTLSSESQNSSSPNTRTLHRLMAAMTRTMPSTQSQRGVSGNHRPM